MKGSARRKLGQQNFMEQVCECRNKGYLLSSRKIGSGTFSKVDLAYASRERTQHNAKLASDLRAKRRAMVAIKIISTAEAPVEFSQKFLPREISSLNATYKHLKGVGGAWQVQLYEAYQSRRRSYLVLELAARGDLLRHISWGSEPRCSPGLDEQEARGLPWQLVSALAHCRGSGIAHRDLKCENILLGDRGVLKLTDFGFASQPGFNSSLLSTFCGSVAYTAPEILLSKKYNREQADLWSLGIILYAMVTGKLPFKERQPHRTLHQMRRGPTLRPGMSPECQDMIRGLLQLHPCARLGLQQVATHCWMLPVTHMPFGTMLRMPPGKPAKLEHTEPGRDSEPPEPLRQCPQQRGPHLESAFRQPPEPPEPTEAGSRGGTGSAQLGLWSMRPGSLGVGASR